MLIEFTRTVDRDDEDGFPHLLPISINPHLVGAVFPHAERNGITIIRLGDGRGFSVRDPYNIVAEKLNAAMNGNDPRKIKPTKAKSLLAPTAADPASVDAASTGSAETPNN